MAVKRKTKAKSPAKEREVVTIPIVWDTAPEIAYVHADLMGVSHLGGKTIYLVFGQHSPHFGAGVPEQLVVKTVAKVATSPKVLRSFIETLTRNLDRLEAAGDQSEIIVETN